MNIQAPRRTVTKSKIDNLYKIIKVQILHESNLWKLFYIISSSGCISFKKQHV